MRLKTRVMIVVCASLLGLLIMGFYGLLSMREAMMAERRAQIRVAHRCRAVDDDLGRSAGGLLAKPAGQRPSGASARH